jgi:hypothetical protein
MERDISNTQLFLATGALAILFLIASVIFVPADDAPKPKPGDGQSVPAEYKTQ